VTVEMYDHHRAGIAAVTRNVRPGKTTFELRPPRGRTVEGLHLQIGGYDGWFDLSPVAGGIGEQLGGYQDKPDE
jgi:hypothetical protein